MSKTDEIEVSINDDEIEVSINVDETDVFAQSIAEKMQIARNVVIQCERMHNAHDPFPNSDIVNILNYTGVCEETIRISDMSLKMAKTFNEWFEENRMAKADYSSLEYASIRGVVVELYTNKVQMAIKDKLLKELLSRCHKVTRYSESMLMLDIRRHGFTWKRLPGTKKTILMERTDQSLNRMEYLARMKAYREAGRAIVYADCNFFKYQLAVSPQYGLIYVGFNGVKEVNDQYIKEWTMNTLVAVLPPSSVVVLKADKLSERETPTPYSSKSCMIKWLTESKVDHDPSLHRSDLYAIINKNKRLTGANNVINGIINSYGHDVVYLPQGLKKLDYLELMWPGAPLQRYKTDTIVTIKERSNDDWQRYEKILMNREEVMYQEDTLLENVVDKLLTLAKYGELSAAELEECDDEQCDYDYYASIIYE